MLFNERLKQLRIQNNITQLELSRFLGLSKSTIAMYEKGRREPNFETIEKIADFFNVDMNFLLGKSNNPNKHKLAVELSLQEQTHIKKYRSLSPKGQIAADNMIDSLLSIEQNSNEK